MVQNVFINIKEAAKLLNVTEYTVRKYIHEKRFIAYKIGNFWNIKKEHLQEYIEKLPSNYEK